MPYESTRVVFRKRVAWTRNSGRGGKGMYRGEWSTVTGMKLKRSKMRTVDKGRKACVWGSSARMPRVVGSFDVRKGCLC